MEGFPPPQQTPEQPTDPLEELRALSQGDTEVFHHLVNEKIKALIEEKRQGNMTATELMAKRTPLDESIPYETLAAFKQQELIDAFSFEGNEDERRQVLAEIAQKESISSAGSNQKGVFELSNNRIVKIVSEANYPYELPMVTLTKNLSGGNVIKTYDVFKHEGAVYVVQEKASGKDIHSYTPEEIAAIPQEHYDELVKLVNRYAEHGIGTDPSKLSNLFYDPEKGFTVIDLGAATYQRGLDYHIGNYFTHGLSQEKIEKAVATYGEYKLRPILPTLQEKLAKRLQ